MQSKDDFLNEFKKRLQLQGLREKTLEDYMGLANRLYPITLERIEKELLRQHCNSSYNFVLAIVRKIVKTMQLDIDLSGYRYRKSARRVKHHEELLTRDEVYALIQHAKTAEASAAIAICYDGALRVGELLSIKTNWIQQDQYGYKIIVDGKTGQRAIRLIESAGYLNAWLRHRGDHPGRVFSRTTSWFRGHIYRARERAGIKKRVYPHLLRHTRLTELAKKLPRQALIKFAGWTDETSMDTVYVHFAQSDIDDEVLKAAGIIKNDTEAHTIRCPRCHVLTSNNSAYCSNCGALLRIEEEDFSRLELETLMTRVLQDPKVQRVVIDRLKDILREQKRQ
ncbi:MAG: tyrosine-type recombinase/integrase [Candidatus Thorarchaeota archaeon]